MALEEAATASQCAKAAFVIGLRPFDVHDGVAGHAAAARREADDYKQNGAERRGESEGLHHESGTLADQSLGLRKRDLKPA